MAAIVERVLHLNAAAALGIVFALPALEASVFLGVVFPGETAVILGGVLAFQGTVPLWAVITVAISGAVIGDQIGYWVGRKYGERLLRKVPDRLLSEARLARAQAYLRRLGAKGVILGRWTAALRALVPGLAGMARMPYRRFFVANLLGGAVWATGCALAGYLAGNSWRKVQSTLGTASLVILAIVVVAALLAFILLRRRREHTAEADALADERADADPVEASESR